MKKCLYILLVVFLIPWPGFSQLVFDKPISDRIVQYDIRASLDIENKQVNGAELLTWRNPSMDTIQEIQLHLYLNAFKNDQSTFFKESGGAYPTPVIGPEDPGYWGWIEIHRIQVKNGRNLTKYMEYIQPDDNNRDDQTVARIFLPDPVLPGEELELEIDFTSRLPGIFRRTGYADEYYFVAQWFPKIGVYEPAGMRYSDNGAWNCHQFHANSEFYSDFGVYQVDISLPAGYVVGATGILTDTQIDSDSIQRFQFRAEDVVDFAWTASPRFQVVEERWKDIDISLLIMPEHLDQADRYIQSLKSALSYFETYVEKYPYPNVTIVSPPVKAFGSGGMEYPTLFTVNAIWKMPAAIRLPELVTIHEFCHNYFMGMLASNEFEEAWLDEGFASYFETKIMDHTYGTSGSVVDLPGFKIGSIESQRMGYTSMKNPKIAEVFRAAWEYEHGGYGSMSYAKTATWLHTLERLIGKPTMEEIIRTYWDRWKFKHPCGSDFIDIVNEIVVKNHGSRFGASMDWFFEQVLFGSDVCDYKVHYIRVARVTQPEGVYEISNKRATMMSEEPGEKLYNSSVIIHRMGEMVFPQEILIHFEDGREVVEYWNGMERTFELNYVRPQRVAWAMIDPEEKILLDINFANNSYTLDPEKGFIRKLLLKILFVLQNLFQTASLFA